jgi:hypothetical protein
MNSIKSKKFFIFLVIIFLYGVSIAQKSKGFVYYYKNPKPEKIVYTIAANKALIDGRAKAQTVIFIAMVLKSHPHVTDKLRKDFKDKLPGFLNVFYESLWRADTPAGKKIIATLDQSLQKKYLNPPQNLLTIPLAKPEILNQLWAAFCATGDIKYAKRVYEAAMTTSPDRGVSYLTVKVARMSIPPNAKLHEKVASFLKKQRIKVKGKEKRKILLAIIKKAGLK